VNDELFKAMTQSIIDGDAEVADRLARQAVEQGINPMEAINQGFIPGVNYIGEQFSAGLAFLPELVMAGDAMKAAINVLEAEMARTGAKRDIAGRVIVATVEGDIHDIGKTLVGIMLSIGGFEVHDLGTDVSIAKLLETTREIHPDIVGLSALLTTTMTKQRDFIEALEEAGLRQSVRVMVGGAPVTRAWAEEIGADGFSEDAVGAVELARSLVAQKG
jgi:corrinoid protein of di/trimethylamine methyltransferase